MKEFDWDTMIEPIEIEVNYNLLRECLAEQTCKEVIWAYQSPTQMMEMNGENGKVTTYQINILMRWCRALQIAGCEADMKSMTSIELLNAIKWQERMELDKVFWTSAAREMREAGNTDLEILRIFQIDLYEMYFEVKKQFKIADRNKPSISPYSQKWLRETILTNGY
ncbi:MAG: hypothetical protein GXZ15_04980 [Campylobacter sp.]|nr:hypothetical protein [Campylobacter sp.]